MSRTSVPPTPSRQIATYLLTAYGLALAVALGLPHAHIDPLVSLFIPVTAVGVVTFTVVPRGRRRALWSGFGLQRAGLRQWSVAAAVPVLFLCSGTASPSCWVWRTWHR